MTDTFTKHHGRSVVADSRRLRILADVCGQVEGVVCPRVLRVDESSGFIEYARMDLARPLSRHIGDAEVYRQVGELLARMHTAEFQPLPGEFAAHPFPLESMGIGPRDARLLSEALPLGWFHSDFWHGNIFATSNGQLAVIDPLPASFLFSHQHISATGAADVVTMYMSLIAVHPIAKQIVFPLEPRVESAESFLEAYLRARNAHTVDVARGIRRAADAFAVEWSERSCRRLLWPIFWVKKIAFQRVRRQLSAVRGRPQNGYLL